MVTAQSNKIPIVQIHDCSNNFTPYRSGTHQLTRDFAPKNRQSLKIRLRHTILLSCSFSSKNVHSVKKKRFGVPQSQQSEKVVPKTPSWTPIAARPSVLQLFSGVSAYGCSGKAVKERCVHGLYVHERGHVCTCKYVCVYVGAGLHECPSVVCIHVMKQRRELHGHE